MNKKNYFSRAVLHTVIAVVVGGIILQGFLFMASRKIFVEPGMLTSVFAVIGFGLMGSYCFLLYQKKDKFIFFAVIGMFISLVGLLLMLLQVWGVIDISTRNAVKIMTAFVTLSVATGYSSVLLLIEPKKKEVMVAQAVTITLITVTALILIIFIFADVNSDYYQIFWSFAVLAILGSISTLIMNKVYSR